MYHIVKWIVYASQLLKSKTLFMSHVCTPLPSHPDLLFGYLLTKNSEIFERRLCFVDISFPENIFIDHLTNILLKFLPFFSEAELIQVDEPRFREGNNSCDSYSCRVT